MKRKHVILLTFPLILGCMYFATRRGDAELVQNPIVRLAELDIDPAQLEEYKAALKEEIAASIRLEPGVITLYAVSVKGQPQHIRLFETYRDNSAYRAHIESEHFKKYKQQTRLMVKSLVLLETDPILLGDRRNPA